MSFVIGIVLGIIIAILILIFILCLGILTTLDYADKHIDNLANTIRGAIEKGKEIAKNKKEEDNAKEGVKNENPANQSAFVNNNLIYSENEGKYTLK